MYKYKPQNLKIENNDSFVIIFRTIYLWLTVLISKINIPSKVYATVKSVYILLTNPRDKNSNVCLLLVGRGFLVALTLFTFYYSYTKCPTACDIRSQDDIDSHIMREQTNENFLVHRYRTVCLENPRAFILNSKPS